MKIHAVAVDQIIVDSISRLADDRRGFNHIPFRCIWTQRFTDSTVSLPADIEEFLPLWSWILPHRNRTMDLPRVAPIARADLHDDHIAFLDDAIRDILRRDTGSRRVHGHGTQERNMRLTAFAAIGAFDDSDQVMFGHTNTYFIFQSRDRVIREFRGDLQPTTFFLTFDHAQAGKIA